MDFSELRCKDFADEGAVMTVCNPFTGEEMPEVMITLLGSDSTIYQNRMKELRRKALNRKSKFNVVDAEEEAMENRIALTINWTGITLNGVDLCFNESNVRKIYEDPNYKWLIEQIDKFVSDRSNFFRITKSK